MPEKSRHAVYYAAHREERKLSIATYHAEHREKARGYSAAYRVAHRDEIHAHNAAYRAAHPEIARLNNARRRAQIKGLPTTLTKEQWQAILAAYKNRCAYCGKPPPKGKKLTKDRVLAGTRGGGYTRENIVPACGPCNSRKNNNPPSKPVKLVLV